MEPVTQPGLTPTGQRSFKERILQSVIYEIVAISFLTPIYCFVMDVPLHNSLVTMTTLSVILVIWAAIYNTIFDRVMWRMTGRASHEKPQTLRFVHSVLYEITITLFAVPIIMYSSGAGFWAALVADIGFSVLFVVYTYVFHLTYDWLRPVKA